MFGPDAAFSAIMIDEFAIQQRPRWRQSDDVIIGLCQHAGEQKLDLTFANQAVLDTLVRKHREGEIHIAKEASNIGIAPFRGHNNHFRPLLCLPTCKKDVNVQEQVRNFEAVVEELVLRGGNPLCLSSDGDAPRRQALTNFCTVRNLRDEYGAWKARYDAVPAGGQLPAQPRAARIYEAIFEAVLFDYSVGPHEVTEDYDWKHLIKRVRELLKSPNGSHRINGITVTTADYRDAFRDILKYDEKKLDILFNPEQCQDVEEAVEFLESVAEICHCNVSDFERYNRPGAQELFYALQFMGRICGNLTRAFLDVKISVAGHLELLSELSGMLILGYSAELDKGSSSAFRPFVPIVRVLFDSRVRICRQQEYLRSGGTISRYTSYDQALLFDGSKAESLRTWFHLLSVFDW